MRALRIAAALSLLLASAPAPGAGGERESPAEPLSLSRLALKSQAELEGLYGESPAGEIPNGEGRGKAIFFPGSVLTLPPALAAALFWQGKVFDARNGVLVNRVLGLRLVAAKVFLGESWFDGEPAIILDYKETSGLFSGIRDELRQVAPGLYLGRVYLRKEGEKGDFALNFALDFRPGGEAEEESAGAPPREAPEGRPEAGGAELGRALELIPGLGSLSAESAGELGRDIQDLLGGVSAARLVRGEIPTLTVERESPAGMAVEEADLAPGSRPEAAGAEAALELRSASAPGSRPEAAGEPPAPAMDAKPPATSNFAEVWAELKKDPRKPPFAAERVSFWSLLGGIFGSTRRTVDEHSDLRPDFKKLIRPNGIALSGTWEITEATPYTGHFKRGKKAVVIARASTFTDDTRRGEYRSFGLALKLYPADDPADKGEFRTANIFLIDDNGGTLTPNFTDAELTTHPKLSLRWGLIFRAPILALVNLAQRLADRNPGYRQLYPVSEMGMDPAEGEIKTPLRMKLVGARDMPRVDAEDFREELEAARYGADGLRFDVFTAEDEKSDWRRVGLIRFTDSVVSDAADRRLHFPHPRHKKDPGY